MPPAAKTAKPPGTALAGFKSTGALMPRTKGQSGGGSGDSFIWTAHKQSGLWDDISAKIKDLRNSNLVYVSADHVEKLNPMKFHVLEAFRFYADLDGNGEMIKTYDEEADNRPKSAGEFVEALILVYTKKGPKVARTTFKKAMCRAIQPMLDEYAEADSEDWGKRSKEHGIAAKNVPSDMVSFRFYGEATSCSKPTKDGKFEYPLGNVTVHPSTSTEFATLKDFDNASLTAVQSAFRARVADIKSKM